MAHQERFIVSDKGTELEISLAQFLKTIDTTSGFGYHIIHYCAPCDRYHVSEGRRDEYEWILKNVQ
mgnify:CR=1 FL=1